MKRTLQNLIIGIAVLTVVSEAQTVVTLPFDPTLQSIEVGDLASVDIVASSLGNLASPSLGMFDIDFTYNPAVLSANSLTFGIQLDLGTFESTQFLDLSNPGVIHFDEALFEAASDMNNAQPDSFVLGTIDFTGIGARLSQPVFGLVSLPDENGQSIQPVVINSTEIWREVAKGLDDTSGVWQPH